MDEKKINKWFNKAASDFGFYFKIYLFFKSKCLASFRKNTLVQLSACLFCMDE